MKKSILYASLFAAMMTISSCDEDYTDWADPITNAQEAVNGSMSGVISAATSEIKRETVDAAAVIPVVKYESTENGADVTSVSIKELYLNGTYSVPFTQEGNVVSVVANDIDSVVTIAYNSLAYTKRELSLSVLAGANTSDGSSYIVSSNDVKVSYLPQNVIPACHQTVESAYYYVGGYNGWNLASPTPMTSNGDGTFSVEIEVSDSEWFAFAPQSAVDAQDWNALFRAPSNGYAEMEGFLGLDPTSGNSFCLEKGGLYRFTINPYDYTYKIQAVAKEMYYVGDVGGWNIFYPLAETADGFTGYYYILDADQSSTWGFKFTTTPDWENPQYGAGAADNTIALDGGNIDLPAGYASGFYQINVNAKELTFSLVPITHISIIGSATGDPNWGTDLDLTFNTTDYVWEGTFDLVEGEYKFRANHTWDISWGGAPDALTADNGANMTIASAGKYTFRLYPNCNGKGHVEITKQ